MNHIVKDIIAFTNDKTPLYKIIYAEPNVEDCGNHLEVDVRIKTIILDFDTWESNLPLPHRHEWEVDTLLLKWDNLIDKEIPNIDKEILTGIMDPEENEITCRKLSINLLN